MKMLRVFLCTLTATFGYAQATPTVLEGGGVRLSVDLAGFQRDLGVEKLGKTYFRLIQFSSDPASKSALGGELIGSVLVDDVPVNSDTKAPFDDPFEFGLLAAMKQLPAPFLGPTKVPSAVFRVQRVEVPAGVLMDYPDMVQAAGQKVYQHQIYFETLHGTKWIEFHFSVPADKPIADPSPYVLRVKTLVSTLKFL